VALAELRQQVDRIVARYPSVRVEPKPVAVAVHLRQATEADAAGASADLAHWVGTHESVHTLHGKQVLELSVVADDKGTAFDRLRTETAATAAVFIGDDATDEHAFAVLRDGDLGIKVGPGDTSARTRIDSPAAVGDLLGVLLSARRARLEARRG
jgi:trehalose-phosphatase